MLESRCHVGRVGYETKPKTGFLSLAEELMFYILRYLSYRDILRCTSVCKALRQAYMSSSELQYTIELIGQRLIPVPNTNYTPIGNRLKTLKDRSHAWFKFDMYSFVSRGHFSSWDETDDLAAIIPILPKPSQRTIERCWSLETLRLEPHSVTLDVLIDLAQNLIAVAYCVTSEDNPLESDEAVFIDLRALDGDDVHPQAAQRTLFLWEEFESESDLIKTTYAKLKCCGRHIALQRSLAITNDDGKNYEWDMQIWDWQNSATRRIVTGGATPHPSENQIDFCFLGNDRLLIVADDLEVFSMEDLKMSRRMARFKLPLPLQCIQCHPPMDNIEQMQTQPQTVRYTPDPKHQLLCLTGSYGTASLVFIISTRIFFDLDEVAETITIPWIHWGPSNTRVFRYPYQGKVHVSGNRVLQAFTISGPDTRPGEYGVRLMDFSPIAGTNRQGLGRVVKESSTIEMSSVMDDTVKEENLTITTSLPYVEVVSKRKFSVRELLDTWLDKDRIYLLNANWKHVAAGSTSYPTWESNRLEVIDV
ncbi:uncharacterized protein F5147DRAFT_837394 [Suillus discolor]|uniref:F-box domain-containing protein n=1 Tax=Suillus discolor TaxID=1912936 RepID=A0A9P7JTL6_9AGAM|nr:uncharacterized protein F5147DRAFT_837394 [Suillus discolor]KAG2107488.1 hypothetical protein F5147DRAFT_837394 [Suillus discolor]